MSRAWIQAWVCVCACVRVRAGEQGSWTGVAPYLASHCLDHIMHLKASDFDLNDPVTLPNPSKIILALNAALATRVHAANASAAVDAAEWQADMDSWFRQYRQERRPSSLFDRITCVQFVSPIGVVTAFLEGLVSTSRPFRLGDVLPSVAPAGVSVALGVLAAATTTAGVNAGLQLLWYWSGGVADTVMGMQRLRGTFVVSQLLRKHARAGLVDALSVRLLLYLAGLWDAAVTPPAEAPAIVGVPLPTAANGEGSVMTPPAPSGVAPVVVGSLVTVGGDFGRGSGQVLADLRALRYYLMAGNLWLDLPDDAQSLFLQSIIRCAAKLGDAARLFNRVQLRRVHMLRHLLFAMVDSRMSPARLTETFDLVQVLLVEPLPHLPYVARVAGFLSATLSSQLRGVAAVDHSDSAPGVGARATTPLFPVDHQPLHIVVHVRNRLLEMLTQLVKRFVETSSEVGAAYRGAMFTFIPFRWLGMFLDASGHLSTVTAALRLLAAIVPFYWPLVAERLALPGAVHPLKKLTVTGFQMPTFHWLSDQAPLVHTVCDQLFSLLCVAVGKLVPSSGPKSFSYSYQQLEEQLRLHMRVVHPEALVMILRVLRRSFQAVDAPSTLTEGVDSGTIVAPEVKARAPINFGVINALRGLGVVGGGATAAAPAGMGTPVGGGAGGGGSVAPRLPSVDARRRSSRRGEHGSQAAPTIAIGSMFDSAATVPVGSAAIVTTMRYFGYLYANSPDFATYWFSEAREPLLLEFASVCFAAGSATADAWRDALAAGVVADGDLPPAFPFHHPTAVSVLELLVDVLFDWITKAVPKAVASVEYLLSLHPCNGTVVVGANAGPGASGGPRAGRDQEDEWVACVFQMLLLERLLRRLVIADLNACDLKVLTKLTAVVVARQSLWFGLWKEQSGVAAFGATPVSPDGGADDSTADASDAAPAAPTPGSAMRTWVAVCEQASTQVSQWCLIVLKASPKAAAGGGVLSRLSGKSDAATLREQMLLYCRASFAHRIDLCVKMRKWKQVCVGAGAPWGLMETGARGARDRVLRLFPLSTAPTRQPPPPRPARRRPHRPHPLHSHFSLPPQVFAVFEHIMHEKDLLLSEPQKKQVAVDQEFIMSLLHLVFELLFDDNMEVRYSAMGLFRELMLKRNLRALFMVDVAAQGGAAGAPAAAAGEFKSDLYAGGFDRLVVDPDNKTGPSRDKANPAIFEGFQSYLVRLLPQFRTYVASRGL
jgi:hypothetical protein